MKTTAKTNINFALVKYWGKRDGILMLPQNSSLSVTLDDYGSTTTVEFQPDLNKDQLQIDGETYTQGPEYDRVSQHLDIIRGMSGVDQRAKVVGTNTVLMAAGLASSASGAAAIAAAGSRAAGLDLDDQALSILARRGSGSATRSIHGGFVLWHRGDKEDGSDSYAEQLVDETYWPEFRVIVTIIDTAQKKVKSRAGMKQTVETCPLYSGWLNSVEPDIEDIQQALKDKDFTKLGQVSEYNGLRLHALMLTTKPTILYWQPTTVAVIHSIQAWREEGLESYMTMDAGPQVKVLCLEKNVAALTTNLNAMEGVQDTIVCKIGGGVEYLDRHLF